MHEGIDIGVGYGTPIHAAASGTVVFSGWMDGYGNFVIIDHGGGMATAYGHQSAIAVGGGQSVSQGQVIGYVGCTGHCFGPHLHFEVRINGVPGRPARLSLRSAADQVQVRQVAIALVQVEAVADEELVRDREADVLDRQVVDEAAVRAVEERDSGQ